MFRLGFLLLVLALASGTKTSAGQAEWHDTEGASIRIVTSGIPDADGILRGALEIRLKEGWKTYWRDPGDSGVPPSVSVSGNANIGDPEIGYPPPGRFDDGYSQFAGYDKSVALALSFPVDDPQGELDFVADLFLGICETICIPVQATIDVSPTRETGANTLVVAQAFARLPGDDHAGFHARMVEIDDKKMVVEVKTPEGARKAELFVASTKSHMFGLADRIDGSAGLFSVRVSRSGYSGAADDAHYTLVVDGEAVSGTLAIAR